MIARDIPGVNFVAQILSDQPYLAEERVNHCEEAIVLLAHHDPYLVEKARRCVRVVVDPLAPVLTLEDSLAQREIIWGEDNIFKKFLVEKGDIDSVWAHAAHIVEEQLYIETNGMVAFANPLDGVAVWGSLQTGGGFGGKEEYPSLLAGHAALLAWKFGKPVKMIYDRAEDSSPALLVYEADLELQSTHGTRRVPYASFHTGYKQTVLRKDELIARIRLPRTRTPRQHYFRKVGTRNAQAISKVCFSGITKLNCVRIAVGSVGPVSPRCLATVTSVARGPSVMKAREILAREIAPIDDIRSTARYRLRVAQNLPEEFLRATAK